MHSLATRQVGTRSALAGKAVIVAGRNPRTIRTIQYLRGGKRGNPDIDPLHKRGHTIRHASTSTQVERENSPTGDLPASTDLLELYRGWVAQGRLRWDDEQVRCVMKLRHLLVELEGYEPPLDLLVKLTPSAPLRARAQQQGGGSWWNGKGRADGFGDGERERALVRVLSGEEELANLTTPKGMLITGPPGTGKSLLLSLFFQLLPTPAKRRWHYHAFTLHLYQQVFTEMQRIKNDTTAESTTENMEVAAKKGWRAVFAGGRWDDEDGQQVRGWTGRDETIPFVIARNMILEYHILYFDELQLVDASSAALLRDVLSWYWRLGGIIVSCSNRVPDDLYYAGVQRDRMAGFLDALKSRCEVVELDGGRDWRRGAEEGETRATSWFDSGDEGFESAWRDATEDRGASPMQISVYGRTVQVPAASDRACRFTFTDLCEQPLGPADYISLASTFSTFFIDTVPILLLKNKNEARRLINLVDALYESRCQVFIRAQSTLETMFFPDALDTVSSEHDDVLAAEALSESLQAPSRPNVSLYNPGERVEREKREEVAGKVVSAFAVLGIWTGEDERFAYEEWTPLSKEARRWEIGRSSSSPLAAPLGPGPRTSMETIDDDYAAEAGYSRPQFLRQPPANEERNPPVIKEHHVWGVVDEWGDNVGRWGKGAKAFDGDGSNGRDRKKEE